MTKRWYAFLLIFAAIGSAGCTLLAPSEVQEPRKEMLFQIPAELPARPKRAAVLLVLPPETHAAYDTAQMAYVLQPGQIAYFSQTEWAGKPPEMIQWLLVRTLDRTDYFKAVVTPPFTGHFTHAVRTAILALEQDFTTEPATFHLIFRIQLMSATGNQAIATREIDMREPLPEKSPRGGAVAANEAIAKALREVAEFVYVNAG